MKLWHNAAAVPERAAVAFFQTGLVVASWVLLAAMVYLVIGDRGQYENEIQYRVEACKDIPEVSQGAAGQIEYALHDDSGRWGGLISVSGGGENVSLENQSELISLLTARIERSGCHVNDVSLSQSIGYSIESIAWAFLVSSLVIFIFAVHYQGAIKASSRKVSVIRLSMFLAIGALTAIVFGVIARLIASDSVLSLAFLTNKSFFDILLYTGLIFPIAEEVVFRRLALQVWVNKGLPVVGLLATSLTFAGGHVVLADSELMGVVGVTAFLVSILAGVSYLLSGIRASIAFHMTYNGTILLPLML